MKYLEQKPGPFWWVENARYFLYFVREIAGIVIGLCAFVFLGTWLFSLSAGLLKAGGKATLAAIMTVIEYTFLITFIASIIHSVTWLHAMPGVLPFNLSARGQKIAYLVLLLIWIAISWISAVTVIRSVTTPVT